jgi:hypothetical protein
MALPFLDWLVSGGVGMIAGGGISWGYVKAKLESKMSYGAHAVICEKTKDKVDEIEKNIYDKVDKNHEIIINHLMNISTDIGELKGRK